MKTRVKFISFIIISVFLMTGIVYAEDKNPLEVSCPSSSKAELLKYAANVKVTYEPYEYKTEGFDDPNSPNYSVKYYYLDMKIHNLDEHLYVDVNSDFGDTYSAYFKDMGPDGTITLRQKNTSEISNFTFEIKANTYDCNGQTLRTIRVTLPKYNAFSGREVCSDIPDYYLCQDYILYDIDAANFLSSVNSYKEKLAKEGENNEEVEEDKTNIISATATKISKHKYIVVGTIIAVGCLITFIVIKKKRSSVL